VSEGVLLAAAGLAAASVAKVERRTCFMFLCEDDPDKAQVRTDAVKRHLAFVEANFGRYLVAGPLLAGPGGEMTKSLFIVTGADLDDAFAFMRGDPYVAEGLYRSITAHPFVPAAGSWIGGKIW
jgi:uncharacterized protein YciI